MGRKGRGIPAREDLIDYGHAVAGHAGTMCDPDGELFIKPCVQHEINFYESANRRHPDFAGILPIYMGTLTLNDPADLSSIEEGVVGPVAAAAAAHELLPPITSAAAPEPVDNITWVPSKSKKIKTDLAVVLENASAGFTKPNVMDCKLGVRLWADDAPLQKRQRFDRIAAESTHRDYGFRIAGMKVYRGGADDEADDLDEDGFKTYDKDYGRLDVNNDNLTDVIRSFVFNSAAGIDDDLARAVCAGFARDVQHVEEVLARNETRMYSASLLFVFEGDGDALRRAIDENNDTVDATVAARRQAAKEKPARAAARIDSGISMGDDDDDGELDEPELPKIYTLKLIDMAHAAWTPGLGPDENSLKGVRSLARIFDDLSR